MNVQHFLRLCWLCETMVGYTMSEHERKGRRRVSESKEKKVEAQQKIVIQQKYIDRIESSVAGKILYIFLKSLPSKIHS